MGGAAIGFLIAGLAAHATGNAVIQPLTFATSQSFSNTSNSLVAVPFGTLDTVKFSEPSLVHTAISQFDANNIASDESWAKYKAKGMYYGCLLDMSIENAGKAMRDPGIPPSAESVWQGDLRNDIKNWGWHEAYYMSKVNCDFRDELTLGTKNRIGTALSSLGLSLLPVDAGGDNECYSIEHFDETLMEDGEEVPPEDQLYNINGLDYPCTGAYYRFAVNKKGGVIFAQNLLKPESAALENLGEGIPHELLPQLSRASDIMWAYWVRDNPNPRNIYNYFVNHVRNAETLPLIARVLRNHGLDKLPYWPGLELKMHSEEAEAILGSPLGSTIAHFLLQHKGALGIKNLEGITVFRDNVPEGLPGAESPETQLLFKIIDVPPDEVDDSDTDVEGAAGVAMKRRRWRRGTGKRKSKRKRESKSKQTASLRRPGERDLRREHRVVVSLDAE